MRHLLGRRAWLLAAASLPFAEAGGAVPVRHRLAALESATGGRLGVAAVNTADGLRVDYRADERFAFCSTFKLLAASAILKRGETESGLLQRRIVLTREQMAAYSPITGGHVGKEMAVSALCVAALQYSDNTAANAMIRLLGGPDAVTAFARSIGDREFRLDRWETSLNNAVPGDPRDTTTPAAMMTDLQRLALGDGLGAMARAKLVEWMRGNTTGAKRIRAGVPAGWLVADKTGTGDYGTSGDIGLAWSPGKPPVVLAIYFTQRHRRASPRDDVVATAARIVAETLAGAT